MTYGRTPQQEEALTGRRLVNRHYYGDGRWGWHTRTAWEQSVYQDWRVVKHRPKATTWAKPTGPLARKTHAIRYTLTATHLSTGLEVHLTVWQCGGQAHTQPQPQSHPTVVCAECHARLAGAHEITLASSA